MSMFYELMMRKKEETMYATIKGTLTESPEGVFSGFSASNYLQLQQAIPDLDNNSKLEIFIDCKIEKYDSTNVFFGATDGDTFNIKCQIDNQKRLFGYIYNNTTSTRLVTPVIWATSAVDNSRFQIKYTISNNVLRVERSIDGGSFYGTEVSLGENFTYTKGIKLCLGKILSGSIDLPNSYIKLGGTKYNLQAVVGYTIVGSPTIVDGVVSGFSSDNLLSLKAIDFSKNFEIQTKIKPSSFNLTTLLGGRNYYANGWKLNANGTVRFQFRLYDGSNYRDTSFFVSRTLTTGNIYILNAKRKDRIIYFSVYENGVLFDSGNYEIPEGYEFTKSLEGNYGIGASTNNISPLGFDGEIYVQNDTFIKFDNKMWFNGYEG